jgi:plasmid stabilization system protein ParE
MNRRLVLRRNAEIELAEAVDWYEAQKPGLGDDFLSEFDAALERLTESPFQYQIIEDDIRRAPIRRFPYGILYVVTPDELIVLNCFHGHRDPRYWQGERRE